MNEFVERSVIHRLLTIYVLHKKWDDSQLPMRRFDTYLPYVPTEEQVWHFISTMTDLKQQTMVAIMYSAGLRIGEVCHLRYEDIDRKNMRIHISHNCVNLPSQKSLPALSKLYLTPNAASNSSFVQGSEICIPSISKSFFTISSTSIAFIFAETAVVSAIVDTDS